MKIGIYTLPLNYNYGGLLQAFALQTVLQQMGHEVVVIDRLLHHKEPFYKRPIEKMKRLWLKYVKKQKHIRVFEENYQHSVLPIITQYTNAFIEKNICREIVYQHHTLRHFGLDAIVVGSDQIWRCVFHDSKEKLYNAFLAFAQDWNIKRIAYAASLGVSYWEYDAVKTAHCKKLVNKFNAVSVREKSGVTLCKKYFGIDAKHVLDPTLLLDKEHYLHLIRGDEANEASQKIVVYMLDKTPYKKQMIKHLSNILGLDVYDASANPDDIYASLENRIQPAVEQWLHAFSVAEYIITDSFHACVFSLLFEKEFIVIGNENRGMERFTSLLSVAQIEDRLFTENTPFCIPKSDITQALERLKQQRQNSLAFLQNALS